jgi:hypothetical protein
MLRKTVLVRALSIAFGAAALSAAFTAPVMAQSNATGNIVGTVQGGGAVSILNTETGARRTMTPDASGRYQATAMPLGHYKVDLVRDGKVVNTQEVDVLVGQGVDASFVAASSVQSVQVTGRRTRIDVTNTNNGATFTAKELAKLPIGRNVESIIQLAPNTTRADSRFDGGASFGGGAASENSYYINGFPVVNPLTGLGASQLPFGAIQQAQVLTGGFGAEFGRSVGGVVNVITKSGTNNWEAGAMISTSPSAWRSKSKDFYYADTSKYSNATYNSATDGTLRIRRSQNEAETKTVSGYVGGPIIKDKLFMFLAGEEITAKQSLVNGTRIATNLATSGWADQQTKTHRYMIKLDWNITDDHRLEYTGLGDTPKVFTQLSDYNYATGAHTGKVSSTSVRENVNSNGGLTDMLKYTGNLTSDLTLTALYGRTNSDHIEEFPNYDPNAVLFSTVSDPSNRAPGFTYSNPNPQTGNVLAPGSRDEVKSFRLDLEYRLGSHTLRAGLDQNKIASLKAGVFKAGGGTWTYLKTDKPNEPIVSDGASTGYVVASGGGLGTQGYYVQKGLFSTVTDSYGEQTAQYLEDKYQLTKNLLLTAGLRRESFKNQNDFHQTFLEMKNQYNPRFAAAWDVNGDSSLKVFGTAGRYSVPIPTHISVRGAGISTFSSQYFTYTGVDPTTGAPTGLTQLTIPLSSNNELGQAKDIKTLAALNMKPSYQDELTIGFEKAFSPDLNFGAKATYRKLQSTIDDFCDVRPFEKFAARNNIAITNPLWGATCQTFNPGVDNTFYVDFKGGGTNDTLVALTAAEQGFEKVKRTYAAVDLFAEHPLRNGWYGKVNYTWSRNQGNTEGQVRSDNGQQDVAVTSVWDYPELMAGANGLLPNDRTRQIKAFGYYEITPEIGVGANLLLASGRPRSCIGSAPNPGDSPNYSNQTFYCLGATKATNVLVPRGTVGNLPADKRLDLNVEYKPAALKGLSLKLDVFNVFNAQTIQNVSEAYNTGTRVVSTYELPLSATAPRSARLTAAYDIKF